jgi:ribosomal protein L37AE/L43A
MPNRENEFTIGKQEPGEGLCPFCGNSDLYFVEDAQLWQCHQCERTFVSPSYGPGGKIIQPLPSTPISQNSEATKMTEESKQTEEQKQNKGSMFSRLFKKSSRTESQPLETTSPEQTSVIPKISYVAEISRRNPTCILIMIDQSNSMKDPFGNDTIRTSKASFVADAVNSVLNQLIVQNQRGAVVNRFYIGLLGYGSHVGSAFGGNLSGQDLVPLDELQNNPVDMQTRIKKEPDGAGGYIELEVKFPTWVATEAGGMTPMCKALKYASDIISSFIQEHPDCFPPIVLNITDGEATDGDPSVQAHMLTRIHSNDGNVLLFNLHCSSEKGLVSKFPTNDTGLDAEFGKLLLYMSSKLPPIMIEKANSRGFDLPEGARGFVFNSGIADVVDFLKIGTTMSEPSTNDIG